MKLQAATHGRNGGADHSHGNFVIFVILALVMAKVL
jgi:hypothetical protein